MGLLIVGAHEHIKQINTIAQLQYNQEAKEQANLAKEKRTNCINTSSVSK
jgi:hypothetical protein